MRTDTNGRAELSPTGSPALEIDPGAAERFPLKKWTMRTSKLVRWDAMGQ
jgi:hypothetical protein